MRGISGVVIAVLLTVIGIVAVLAFWAMFSGMFSPMPKIIIEKATLTKIGNNQYDLTISVREVGGASTQINEVKLMGGDLTNEQTCTGLKSGSNSISPGQSQTLVYECSLTTDLKPGVTYYLRVTYQKGTSNEATDLYPVTVR